MANIRITSSGSLSLYWLRTSSDIKNLVTILFVTKLQKGGVCIRVIGNLSLLPKDLCKMIAEVAMITRDNKKLILNCAFPYTSRDDITRAIEDIAKGVKRSDILPEDVDEHLITDCLYTCKSSNPDLLIRTSGETRLSDFLMWEIADTYLYFPDVLWPEFSLWHFLVPIFHYQRCFPDLQRNKITKPILRNSRVSMFLDKLYRGRDIMIENMYLLRDTVVSRAKYKRQTIK
ncbi:PREDICTED: dehydrodolichyl diphosphate syntase complex subunit DHDDS-like [Vollenhovia emeryi]|uniref:dehydrodolichyl diphosphate syntase complex subunit DHDDS-like n=1 Tax=Vollenhovia emeryi TaxID=411798 RepID=UPI0005F501F2|nr:PREDICTED: dehydrodolichyl diphosphate syntase complex subunit DHDDS-like [Vollenhovia emeryi]